LKRAVEIDFSGRGKSREERWLFQQPDRLIHSRTNDARLSPLVKIQPVHLVSFKPVRTVAEREGMDRAYVSRMVNLTTLAPDIVAAILDETLPSEVTLFDLASGTPLLWDEQRAQIQSVCRVVSPAGPDD